ncbi:DUF488 family protein [Candidatus Poriferisocius sp.]|uniref:DUF488 domain-containing protein n=1 Tax=Candidatus Poriferisocius sp. TaxID=3101276 RepID=UPI003B59A418
MGSRITGKLVSVGYERRTIDELVSVLRDAQVQVLVDVRLNAISRKRGFSKTALARALANAGIEYRHERALGNPKDNRDGFRRGLREARRRYERHLAIGASPTKDEIVELARSRRIALFCYERDHADCHRSCITESALRDAPELQLVEL